MIPAVLPGSPESQVDRTTRTVRSPWGQDEDDAYWLRVKAQADALTDPDGPVFAYWERPRLSRDLKYMIAQKSKNTTEFVKVQVESPFRIVHEGKVYTDGDVLEAPVELADQWIKQKCVKRVATPRKAPAVKGEK